MKKIIIPVLALAVTGCTATSYKSLAVDSPSPPVTDELRRCPAKLEDGNGCMARVQADQWTTRTGIQVAAKGETYCISVLPNQVWFDADRRNAAPHGEKGSWVMNVFQKRHLEAAYFSLMVAVQPQPPGSTVASAKEVGRLSGGRYTADGAGMLVLYPNDAVGPSSDPEYFYKNNSGYIWVSIKQCGSKR